MSNSISGIYAITNTVNGKQYVGSAVNIQVRWAQHKWALRHNKHHSPYMQRAYNKHGEECFTYSILEMCEKGMTIQREQFYLDTLKPAYNTFQTAKRGMPLGYKMPPETIEKIREKKKNIIVSAATRLLMSIAAKSRPSNRKGMHNKISPERAERLATQQERKNRSDVERRLVFVKAKHQQHYGCPMPPDMVEEWLERENSATMS
jgi:group I intron endonuclease